MYSNNFAAAIIVNGSVLRELEGNVYLPFGSEYSIRLKNVNSSRCKVRVEIDGRPVTDGGIVIDSFSSIDLERFVRSGNLDCGNRFKFIERTAKVEENRGIGVEDGIVSIQYEFETPPVTETPLVTVNVLNPRSFSKDILKGCGGSMGITSNYINQSSFGVVADAAFGSVSANSCPEGITVEGSLSNQKFSATYWRGTLGPIMVMNFKLFGHTVHSTPQTITQPLTVKSKPKCVTCGTLNKATAKFCCECGTSLVILN